MQPGASFQASDCRQATILPPRLKASPAQRLICVEAAKELLPFSKIAYFAK